MTYRRVCSVTGGAVALLSVCLCCTVGAEELTSGELLIRGATLEVWPAKQEIDPGRPTVVHTSLGGLGAGEFPSGLRVLGDLSGPGFEQSLQLSTTPGDPFRIPGLNREGTYYLSGIRLVDGERLLSSAVPDEPVH